MNVSKSAPRDEAVIEVRFDYRVALFFALLFLYLLLTTCFKINGSSAGMWSTIIPQNKPSNILLGTPKQIRSDEWSFHTPAMLSQCNSRTPFSTENYSLGAYKAPLVMNVPVRHFSSLLRPQFWLFFLADAERGYAFYWNAKLVFLLGGVFLLLMLILENNFFLSLFGAAWVYFSGYMQWWYSSPCEWPELVGCFALFTMGLIQILVTQSKARMVLFSLAFVLSFFNFVVFLYPPHQVPFIYLSFFIVLGVLLPKYKSVLSELRNNRFRLACVILTCLLTAGLLALFYLDARQTLDAIANTVYPGRRRSWGGGVSFVQIFNGFFGVFMSDKHYPSIWGNVCESSNFFLFFPVPMMLFGWKWVQEKKVSALHAGLAIFIILILLWTVWGFPNIIAQLTLFDRVNCARTFLPLGIASIIWTCLLLQETMKKNSVYTPAIKIGITAVTFTGISIYAYYFNSATAGFASTAQLVLVCAFVVTASFLLINNKAFLFAGLVLAPNIIAHGLVNPVCAGLNPILKNPLYAKIHEDVQQNPDAKWAVYNEGMPLLANFAYAAGARVFNGLKYIPHLDDMKELSSSAVDTEIYNRYGYISLSPVEGPEISFSLNQADFYTITVDPANDCWKRLHIDYCLIFSEEGVRFIRYTNLPEAQ